MKNLNIIFLFFVINIYAHDTANNDFKSIYLKNIILNSYNNNNEFSILTKLSLYTNNINNSQEILKIIPGLFIAQHAGGGKAEQIFMRGFNMDHGTDIAINIDGIPINLVSHAHGQGYADLHFLIPELINEINYNKGSFLAQYGDFNTAASINIKTKDTIKNLIKTEYGIYNYGRALILFKPITNKNLYFAAEYLFNKSFFDNPQNLNKINAQIKYSNNINSKNFFNFIVTYYNSWWNASGQIPDIAIKNNVINYYGSLDPTEGGKTNKTNIITELKTTFSNKLILTNNLYYSNYNFELYSNFTFFKNDSLNGDEIKQKENRHIFGYNSNLHWHNFKYKNIKMETEFGFQNRNDIILNSELVKIKQRNILPNGEVRFGDIYINNFAFYIKNKISLGKKINIEIGLRNDNFNYVYNNKLILDTNNGLKFGINNAQIFNIWSPKIIFNYKPNQNILLYIKNGYGFHSNDVRSIIRMQNILAKKRDNYFPYSLSTDIGTIFKIYDKLLINFDFFHTYLEQELVYSGDENIVNETGRTRRLGFDLAIRYNPVKYIFIGFDFNYSKARYIDLEEGKNYIPLVPNFTNTGNITYKLNKISTTLKYRIMLDRPANQENSRTALGYTIFDFNSEYLITEKINIIFNIENIFNTKWREAQFDTNFRIKDKNGNLLNQTTDLAFTPGSPINIILKLMFIL